ncbi:hypothetical protein [Shewanella woodyi]|uniref:hypothetical protein n=1 Tax=Shewanella woodyi TaxID=60961 RepID=UPI0007EA08D3|nr:hypothetical protein [Shewanella woodyi]
MKHAASIIYFSISVLAVGSAGISKGVSAATVGSERAGGVKCQRVAPKRIVRTPVVAPVIVIPKHHKHYHSFHSPMLTAMGIAVVLNAAGEVVTEKGQQVIVLGEGNEVSNVYEKEGVVYIIKT